MTPAWLGIVGPDRLVAPALASPWAQALAAGPAGQAAGLRDVAGNASLLFLVGGLAMLALIVVLVILQSLLPDGSGGGTENAQARQLRPVGGTGELAAGRDGRSGPHDAPHTVVPAVDKAMDRAVEARLGEPRLLRVQPETATVRLYACAGCSHRHRGRAAEPGCIDQAAGLGAAFSEVFGGTVRARELACRLRGDPECDFEVRH